MSKMTVISPSVAIAEMWQQIDPNPTTRQYVRDLIAHATSAESSQHDSGEALKELNALFPSDGERISFGTAGLRSFMRPGPLGMNDLTVLQAAQGLARYCLKNQQLEAKEANTAPCAVVGYDHRSNPDLNLSSLSFAVLTAIVFAEAGIDCILLDGFVMTPLVPFTLKYLGAVCGVMVTASHKTMATKSTPVMDVKFEHPWTRISPMKFSTI
jgi:hypothetical protein